jgi:hypothetical protein
MSVEGLTAPQLVYKSQPLLGQRRMQTTMAENSSVGQVIGIDTSIGSNA